MIVNHIRLPLLLILLAIVTRQVAGQTLTVIDSISHEPIAYASVCWGDVTGGYTDEQGTIIISEGIIRVRLSHICYETKDIALSTADDITCRLIPKSISLDEVAVSAKAPTRIKTTEVGLTKEKTHTGHRGTNGFEMALFIPYDSTWTHPPYIHSILASLDYSTHWLTFTTIKNPIHATLRFDLRQTEDQTGAPRDESVIDGGVIVGPDQKVGKEGIRLAHPIPFPRTGVFVVVEWITTAAVAESQSLVPALNMTLDETDNRTWNRKAFRSAGWMREADEPIYKDTATQGYYKGRTPSAKLGLRISK